jgi:hypothetical protein
MRLAGKEVVVTVTVALALACMAIGDMKETKRETLAGHETVAEFQGVTYHECRGLTAQCPDRCGESGNIATFKIIKYISFEKLSQYGQEQKQFTFMVEDNMKNAKVFDDIRKTVESLKKGDQVILSWNHDYVTKNGSSGPERPLTKLEKYTESEEETE